MRLLALLTLAIVSSLLSVSSQAQQSTIIFLNTASGQKEKKAVKIIGNDIYEVSPSGQINKKIGQVE